jgi:trimeric autotransporter adhesin
VPSTVTVPGGTTSVTFPFTTKVITSPSADATSVSIRTVISGVTQTLSWPLTITPVRPGVSGVSFLEPNGKSYVRPGHGANGTVGLTGPAPTSGVVVKLTTDNPNLVVPATVTVPAGYRAFDFPITASSQGLRTTATVTASANNLAATMSIGLLPNGNLERIFRPTEGTSQYVAYGTSIDELLALSYPQSTDTVVTLTSSDPRVMVPATVTIPARSPNAGFTVTADSTIAKPETVTLTATLGTETLTQTIAVGP